MRRYYDGQQWGPFEPPVSARPFGPSWTTAPSAAGYSDRSRVVAGLLQLFLGGWGIGRFYLGYAGVGGAQLALGIVGGLLTLLCGLGIFILIPLWLWALVDAIIIFCGGVPDAEGKKLR